MGNNSKISLGQGFRRTIMEEAAPGPYSPGKQKFHCGGFTLIELMVVVGILGTLIAIAIPVYSSQIGKAKTFKAITDIKTIEKEIENYRMNNDTLPVNLDAVGRGNLEDPWGNTYQFANHVLIAPGARRKFHGTVPLNVDYDLFSMGPDGTFKAPITASESRDDIIRADDGGYVGVASEY